MLCSPARLCSTLGLPAAFETVMRSPARKSGSLHLQRTENFTRSWLQNVTDIRSIVILARVNATDENARHLLGNYPRGNPCFSIIITPTRATIPRDKPLPLQLCHFILQLPVPNRNRDAEQHSEFGFSKYNDILHF